MNAGPPTGTVTLLFSDIEGSTNLLYRLGEGYAAALSVERSLMRGAFGRWHGREMGTEGDSFFVVFTSVGDAVNAALEAQRDLARQAWPGGERVRVRMGLHTGEPARHEDGYIGIDVHLAARVASVAAGGQVVLTEPTQRIWIGQPLPGVSMLDLGRHRLKDIPEPVHLYQLVADGLDREFPPVRSLGALPRLPATAATTVGRSGEMGELRALLADETTRLVTLTGPGGTGKTRLALATADSLGSAFPDGIFFVPLESATSADVMWTQIAERVGLTGDDRTAEALVAQLAGQRTLLVLDNLEQLPDAAKVVHELLAAPRLSVLATSRRSLHLYGEFEHQVPPLTLPTPDAHGVEQLGSSGAVQLFVQRVQMVRPGFRLDEDDADDVAAICRLVDGLPLAIELAAARIKVLGVHGLRARLADSLELLATRQGERPARQQTLRNAVTWSYRLLPGNRQWLLRQLGAFSGDFDLDAVSAMAGDGSDPLDAIDELVDVSLVTVRDGLEGEPRFHLLRTVSSFVGGWLEEAGEAEAARLRHAEYYAGVVETVAPQLRNRYLTARDRIEAELDNLRGALEWALPDIPGPAVGATERTEVGLRLCEALSWFWYASGYRYQAEGRRWLSRAVDAAAGHEGPDMMTTLHGLAVLLLQHGENEQARDALRRCLDYWRREDRPDRIATELSSLGATHRALGEPDVARRLLEESVDVARRIDAKGRLATSLSNLALVDLDQDRPADAASRLQEALELDQELGDTWGVAADRINLVGVRVHEGRLDQAYADLSAIARETVDLGDVELTINVIELFATIFAGLDDARRAARLLGAAQAMRARAELPIAGADAAIIERHLSRVRDRDSTVWDDDLRTGAGWSVDEALGEADRAPVP